MAGEMWQERCGRGERRIDTCTRFIAAYLPLSLITAIPLVEGDAVVNEHNPLSEPLGIKTLQSMSMVPGSFRDLSKTGENLQ
jgi:hypothetical protein